MRTNSIVEFTQVWWSVRPHFSFGTVEVRICDAQATAQESEALAALMVACVAQAARDVDEGVPFADPAPRLIEENMWRAIRFGLDGQHDRPRARARSIRRARRSTGWRRGPRRCAPSSGSTLAFPERNGAQRQRQMIDAGATREEVFAASRRGDQADLLGGGGGVSTTETSRQAIQGRPSRRGRASRPKRS